MVQGLKVNDHMYVKKRVVELNEKGGEGSVQDVAAADQVY